MKTTVKNKKNNPEKTLNVCCDVSKDTINIYCEVELSSGQVIEFSDEIQNNSIEIEQMLKEMNKQKQKYNYKILKVSCEPTGNYHRRLLDMAKLLEHETSFISGQAVNRFSSIETNDNGKSDHKDPMVINSLIKLGKEFINRDLDGVYGELKYLNGIYNQEDKAMVQVKNQLHAELVNLFCDWPFLMSYLYGNLGKCLREIYQFNPYKIFKQGSKKLYACIKKYAPKTQDKTKKKLWNSVKSSVKVTIRENMVKIYENRLEVLYARHDMLTESKSIIKSQMLELYFQTKEYSKFKTFDVLTDFAQSRLIAETGPLDDFKNYNQLLRYTGLNLRERESGKWRGETKIAKRGRALFRKVLYFSARAQITHKGGCFYERHQKKKAELGSGNKSLVAIMRFLVKAIFGIYKSKSEFDMKRFFISEKNYLNNAA